MTYLNLLDISLVALWVAYFVRFDTLSFLSDINKNELKNQYEAIKQLLWHLFTMFVICRLFSTALLKSTVWFQTRTGILAMRLLMQILLRYVCIWFKYDTCKVSHLNQSKTYLNKICISKRIAIYLLPQIHSSL